jgi:hypothetical protein
MRSPNFNLLNLRMQSLDLSSELSQFVAHSVEYEEAAPDLGRHKSVRSVLQVKNLPLIIFARHPFHFQLLFCTTPHLIIGRLIPTVYTVNAPYVESGVHAGIYVPEGKEYTTPHGQSLCKYATTARDQLKLYLISTMNFEVGVSPSLTSAVPQIPCHSQVCNMAPESGEWIRLPPSIQLKLVASICILQFTEDAPHKMIIP